jgi:IclR family transcriptional regulator, KDG regulon repressor
MQMSRNVQSLERGLTVLEMLVKNGPTGVTDLATLLELEKTIVHRLLTTLQGMGYVTQDSHRKYMVGSKLRMIGARVLSSIDVRIQALPYMQQLAEQTKGVAHLAKMVDMRSVYIEKVQHLEFSLPSTGVGGDAPGYCSAAGKILWAYLSQDQLNVLLDTVQFKSYTSHTISNRQVLQQYLAQVHAQGYAVDNQEHRLGLIGVGAAVRDHTGSVVASICVARAMAGTDPIEIEETRELVVDAANRLSHDMGYGNGNL